MNQKYVPQIGDLVIVVNNKHHRYNQQGKVDEIKGVGYDTRYVVEMEDDGVFVRFKLEDISTEVPVRENFS